MSSVGRWREEQILIVCPGSKTTLAQIGCSELTLPSHRLPTRMFRDGDEWRPYHTYLRKKVVGGVEQEEWVEDVDSDEGAVYPIKGLLSRMASIGATFSLVEYADNANAAIRWPHR